MYFRQPWCKLNHRHQIHRLCHQRFLLKYLQGLQFRWLHHIHQLQQPCAFSLIGILLADHQFSYFQAQRKEVELGLANQIQHLHLSKAEDL